MAKEGEEHTVEQDIERYRAMLEKDPSSSVFAPLAELLRRGGFLDEALTICIEGLQKHPNHISGKVALGRIYYDMGQILDAKKEFEEVVRLAPDNILASRLLKEICDKAGISNQDLSAAIPEAKAEEGIKGTETISDTFLKKDEQLEQPDAAKTEKGEIICPVDKKEETPEVYGKSEGKEEATAESKSESEVYSGVYTVTMAELLEKQGHYDEALRVYGEILKRGGENAVVKERIDRIKSQHKKYITEKEDERLRLLADWASKFKKGGR